ncbi:carboxypeptidase regulatory-like domain-containing protein [Paenibacillus rhizovicinus]|uniref:Carboxypeptidase regulatory-like domain-containing protein n=1 Tax=Paenibacillus rhizovicinus TaxID=2704463 RepID=A0A6C0NTP2_9BACL|nr:carboxypeptidase-like regulatory domain-containing protein [Paenibacillus rhizovicinus]QHW29590.1 carboxypeptidase regulatory-like domain-containing protein [Paenibacillus rhizovicinus]
MMTRIIKAGLFVLLSLVAAFSPDSRSYANAQAEEHQATEHQATEHQAKQHQAKQHQAKQHQAHLVLEQTAFVVKAWRNDGSHLVTVRGKLTWSGRPVANALLQTGTQGRNIRTGEDGSFELLVDRSLIACKLVRVTSLHEARVDGKPVGQEAVDAILSASSTISVYHPIIVTEVEPSDKNADKIKVHASIASETGDKISFFQADKYRIAGEVGDADGNPIKDAFVWIDRESGEGFAKSTPTDKQGRYEMYYWPEEEGANLTVFVGTRRYALPAGKVLMLPRNTSVNIRIRLPKEGLVIDDRPPMLVCTTAMGATYTGLLAGLDVPPGTSYSLTIPDQNGRFVLTVPKAIWDKHPRFFETRLTKFVGQEKILKAGDMLPVDFVQPSQTDPRIVASRS